MAEYCVEWRESSSDSEDDWERDSVLSGCSSLGRLFNEAYTCSNSFLVTGFDHRVVKICEDGSRSVIE